jgi:hypothetical protein
MSKKDNKTKNIKNKEHTVDLDAHEIEEDATVEPVIDPEEAEIAQLLEKNVKKVKKASTVSVDDELIEMELERELEKDNWD